ncbi:apolipoprotein N-acyltransferase [Blastococcus sp. MG754426]|nr:apolipoprotein N-acyltransferase [Blastococcus sp. MG754426]MCF6513484.1 apolipoprotein N-acyltransferase [Blastococcus sp. MG754427]MCF6736139.1 apolipoprotein N-acyltransferase [Blastococcus sp. KM273129]RBY92519.1 apolipoprotein N-acyltransferase [Blastococcus sp. TF02-8]
MALAVAAGAAWALAAPPRGWWPLLSVGAAALTVALYNRPLRDRLLLGATTGLVLYGATLPWLLEFHVAGYLGVAALEAGLLAGAAALVPSAAHGRWSGGWWALPAALVLLEAVQARFPLGGFPLVALSLSQPDGPFLGAAALGGSLLVTGAAAATGVALAALFVLPDRRRRAVAAGGALAVSVLPVAVGSNLTTRDAGTLDAVVVQGGGPLGERAVDSDAYAVTQRHLDLARDVSGSPDLVLLPENVVHVDGPIGATLTGAALAELARELGAPVVVGIVETEGDGFRNAAVLWGPDGDRLARYEKEHRVPFGEYIPARGLLEKVTDATALVPRDAIVGEGEALLESPAGPLGVVISYEVFFADRVQEAVAAGGQVVLVPTNAASFVTEEVPAAELAAARLRAREFGRTVLQAAPTGYSAVILPSGQVIARSDLGTAALLRERIPLRVGLTPYARSGDLPVIALATLILVGTAFRRRPRQSAADAGHP